MGLRLFSQGPLASPEDRTKAFLPNCRVSTHLSVHTLLQLFVPFPVESPYLAPGSAL